MKKTVEAEGQTTSNETGPDTLPPEALASNCTSRVRADFEGLLELAETIQRSLEEHKESYRRSVMAQQALLLLLVLEGYFGFFITMFGMVAPPQPVPQTHLLPHLIAVALASADVLLFLVTAFYFCSVWAHSEDLKASRRTERQNITEVVELLREIEPVVAKEENTSVMERVQIRIRLSRFGVGSSPQDSRGTIVKTSPEDFHPREGRVDREIMKPLR